MASFSYQAVDTQGRTVKGIEEADSPRQLRQSLRQKGLMPVEVVATLGASNSQKQAPAVNTIKLPATQLSIITRQLSVLLDSSMSLNAALTAMSQQASNKKVQAILSVLKSRVNEGQSFADSLALFPKVFDRLYVSSVAAGEQSGSLDKVLDQLAEHTESQREFRQKTLLALIYPVLVAFMSLAIVIGLMIYIVPQVVDVFAESGHALPVLTRGLIAISDFLKNWGLWLLAFLALLSFAFKTAMARPDFRLAVHKYFLIIPGLRVYSRGVNATRYAQTLGMLSSSGVTLSRGLHIAEQVVMNDYFRQALAGVSQRVVEGESLSHCLAETELFPPLMVHMLASGEASGQLDKMLAKSASQQQNDLAAIVATGVALFEPLMLLIMGGVVLLIVLAILVPILSMNQLVG